MSPFCNLHYSRMCLCVALESSVNLIPVIPVMVSLNLFWSGLKGILGSRAGGGFHSAVQGMEITGGNNKVL